MDQRLRKKQRRNLNVLCLSKYLLSENGQERSFSRGHEWTSASSAGCCHPLRKPERVKRGLDPLTRSPTACVHRQTGTQKEPSGRLSSRLLQKERLSLPTPQQRPSTPSVGQGEEKLIGCFWVVVFLKGGFYIRSFRRRGGLGGGRLVRN